TAAQQVAGVIADDDNGNLHETIGWDRLGHADLDGDAVYVVVRYADKFVDQPTPPSVCTHGRRLVHDDAAAHFSGTAGQQIPLFTPVDHTAFQVFLAANRPAEGKVQPGGVKVDAKPPDACLLE